MPDPERPAAGEEAPAPGEAVARLRHDARTFLTQIIGYSELLQEEAAAREDAVLPDLVKIEAAGRRLLALINEHSESLFADAPAEAPEGGAAAADEPLSPLPPLSRAPLAAPAAADSGPATVLVVDDSEQNREMLSRRLKARGYTVLTAEDGYRALDLIRGRPLDLVVLDIMMPDLSGLELLQCVRQQHSMAELPVIMATARDRSQDTVDALRLGANDYVTKPLDFPVVLARVQTQLSLKRAGEEVRRLARELERRNQFIQKTFGRYLSEEVVSQLLETPGGLRLGGEKRVVTILLADLRGFTAVAERLAPEQVVAVINNYLGVMADVITHYQGTIDEILGDAVLALFGAPVSRPDDARRAVACAVAMQQAMGRVNEINRGQGLPEVQMGIGLNTGEVVVGNLGSHKRTKYGVVGTPVNLAGRIESYTVGGQVLASEATLQNAGAGVVAEGRLTLEAKGIKDPVIVYSLRGIGGEHGLYLERTVQDFVPLRAEVPVRWSLLEGKQVGSLAGEGRLIRLSSTGADVRSARGAEPLANLRLSLDPAQAGPAADLYAKVIDQGPEPDVFRVVFTSVPPEVEQLFRGLRSAAAGSAG
jgi:adenylate cyclase